MNERVPHGKIRIDCTCCQLLQFGPDRDGAIPTVCDACYQHRGKSPEKQLARAESHEAMLRERLAACRTSEARAREGEAAYKHRMVEALRSRGALADRLVEAAETDPSGHTCPAQRLGRDRGVIEFARRHRAQQDSAFDPGDY